MVLEQDKVGFLTAKTSEQEYLTLEKTQVIGDLLGHLICPTCAKDDPQPFLSPYYVIPKYEMTLALSTARYEYERHDYTFVALLSDFGGFNDGLLLLAYGLTGAYSKSMFMGRFSSMFPVRQKPKRKHGSKVRKDAASSLLPKLDADLDVDVNAE